MKTKMTKRALRSRGFSLRIKLSLFAVAVCALILIAAAGTGYWFSFWSLRQIRVADFQSLGWALSSRIEAKVRDNQKEVAAQADTETTGFATAELGAGFRSLLGDLEKNGFYVSDKFLKNIRKQLRDRYQKSVIEPLQQTAAGGAVPKDLDQFQPGGLILQYVYFLNNPAPMGAKFNNNNSTAILRNQTMPLRFRTAFVNTRYAKAMDRYHATFQNITQKREYSDLLLVDNLGNVVYSSNKYWDFGANVLGSWLEHTHLRTVFLKAQQTPLPSVHGEDGRSHERVTVADFQNYSAAFNVPMMFYGCPVKDHWGNRAGVLARETSSVALTEITTFNRRWKEVGLGKTGEAYIIGPDKKLRTDLRYLQKLPSRLLRKTLLTNGTPGSISSVLTAPIGTDAVNSLFSSKPGQQDLTFINERGAQVLAVYAPLNILGLNWRLILQMDTSEALAPAALLAGSIGSSGLLILMLSIGVALHFARQLTDPIDQLVIAAEKIAGGDIKARAPVVSRDEIGFLAERFNDMIEQVNNRNQYVRKILKSVREGLFLISKDLTIQPGYSSVAERIFQAPLDHVRFMDLLTQQSGDMMPLVPPEVVKSSEQYLELLFTPRVKEKLISQANPLTEVEFRLRDKKDSWESRFFEFRFNRVTEQKVITEIMVTVVDTTSQVLLAREVSEREKKSRTQMELLAAVLQVDPAMLSQFLDQSREETLGILQLYEAEQYGAVQEGNAPDRAKRYEQLLQKTSRTVHLIKGSAATIQLQYFVDHANDLEKIIAEIHKKNPIAGEHFLPLTMGLGALLDDGKITREIVARLVGIHEQFGKERFGVFQGIEALAKEIGEREGKRLRVETSVERGMEFLTEPGNVRTIAAQLIRNAVVHGIEMPEERTGKGKNPEGTITIRLIKSGPDRVRLTVRDDGNGIDRERLRGQAAELGIASMTETADWSEARVMELIFEPGFTTHHEVTTDAGRGVGLDAVKDLVVKSGGSIMVTSVLGEYCELNVELRRGEAYEPRSW
jgi:signal transduction histidine kinase/HAMP domain-containing protein